MFDVNVYLDVAELTGEPFSRGACARAEAAGYPRTGQERRRLLSLQAIEHSRSGAFAGAAPLQVWTSRHIDGLVARKASQPADESLPSEDRGLGWTQDHADDLVDDLVWELVYDATGGGRAPDRGAEQAGQVGDEDGRVLSAAKHADPDDQPVRRYCVTNDQPFRERAGGRSDVVVLHPIEWLMLLREARGLA